MLPAVNELDVDLFVVERQQTLEKDKIIPLASFQPVHITVRHSGCVGGLFKAQAMRQAFFPQHLADAADDSLRVDLGGRRIIKKGIEVTASVQPLITWSGRNVEVSGLRL